MTARDLRRRLGGGSASLGALVVVALLPKCPLCIAAWLGAIGVGAGLGSALAPALRPVGIAVAVTCALSLMWSELRRRKRRA